MKNSYQGTTEGRFRELIRAVLQDETDRGRAVDAVLVDALAGLSIGYAESTDGDTRGAVRVIARLLGDGRSGNAKGDRILDQVMVQVATGLLRGGASLPQIAERADIPRSSFYERYAAQLHHARLPKGGKA